ncbi:DeoR/GlpR family DNA-binding transcription regulator [Marinitenerispora sediminis]|uniref:Lactose phosphotransferase system repressor n=1 Tax=Marinitenerispora sediminis TaxID=1931232 RepID=A0A368T2T5_9ACTN|nr:DeoR/GlpR family DNA-binding transcription regulator [Marinitenerispora sediminis]RCV52120.1 decarboxylase [Marinitenerispora sediminis]RCV55523.1 decarboxylase [Marinitenerispora sediminis]RCV57827.1 decarboxylase [Marinitenerispora sediminis]
MDSAARVDAIVARLREAGEATVADLAERTGYSEAAIRADLARLSAAGVLRWAGGSAGLVPRDREPPFAVRERRATAAKRRIAAAVGGLVHDGHTVALDSGTTAAAVARELADRSVTVMPLSLQAASALSASPHTRLVLPGGDVRPGELSLTGPLTEAGLGAVRFDTAVLGCCGLSVPDGVTARDLGEVAVKRAAMRSARRVVMAADSSKLGQVTMGHVGPIDQVDTLVTDTDAPDDIVTEIQASGVAVLRV